MEAISYYAIALGAAKSGNVQLAGEAISTLAELEKRTAEVSKYWAKQVEIQRISAVAWLDYMKGDKGNALDLMKKAATV